MLAAIADGRKFRVLFTDDGGLTRSHLVDIPFYWTEEGSFSMTTHVSAYPALFENFAAFEEMAETQMPGFLKAEVPPQSVIEGRDSPRLSYFNLHSDGSYYTIPDIPAGRLRSYGAMTVFAD